MQTSIPGLAIIIPCLNEESAIPSTFAAIHSMLEDLKSSNLVASRSFICFVDDGSKDSTWLIIEHLSKSYPCVKGVKLSTNYGHQSALLAGLYECKEHSDCYITIDADLQDDLKVIPEMIQKFRQGYEIIYGVRRKRNTDSLFKRVSASGFYNLMRFFGVSIIYNHADFRLISTRVLDELQRFSEVNLFLRGIFPLIGFKNCEVYYDRNKRMFGKTKYPFRRMLSFAFEGISSFSVKPLRIITTTGFIIFILCLFAMAYALWGYISDSVIPGWFSTVVPFYFLGGLQILCLGIIGEYLGKIYKEVKRRPPFIIEDKRGFILNE
jgi:polyisoprenyl-phosphate glycosyltransferase